MRAVVLGEVATIDRDGIDASAILTGTRYVGLENIESGGHSLTYSEVETGDIASTKFRFSRDHVLFGKLRPYLAKIVCAPFDGVCSTDILPIRSGPKLDRRYLAHFLREPKIVAWAASRATGINLPRLSPSQLEALEIPLPPLEEQRRIAAILDKADALRRQRRRALHLLDGLTQSIFLEMFGGPSDEARSRRRQPLGEVIRVKSGDGLVAKDMSENGHYLVFGGNGVSGRHNAFMFEDTKLVIGRVGVYCGSVHLTPPRSWVTDNALYISELKKPMSLTYLAEALKEANLNSYAGRSSQPLISGSRIYSIEICVPPIKEQNVFEERVEFVRENSRMSQSNMRAMDTLFSSLQHRAFTGQL